MLVYIWIWGTDDSGVTAESIVRPRRSIKVKVGAEQGWITNQSKQATAPGSQASRGPVAPALLLNWFGIFESHISLGICTTKVQYQRHDKRTAQTMGGP